MKINQICVYCASSPKIPAKYFEAAESLGKALAEANIRLVFGGGSTGLMGALADTVLREGGEITGIMPEFMREVEWNHKGVADLRFVTDMAERKKQFLIGTDAVVALPGGCGTFEELLEAITWKRLGLFTQPIIVVNIDGYYDPLLEMLQRSIDENFMTALHGTIWSVVSRSEEVLEAVHTAPAWDSGAIKHAAVK